MSKQLKDKSGNDIYPITDKQIIIENIVVEDINIEAKGFIFNTLSIPQKEGYTLIGMFVTGTRGFGSGYVNITPRALENGVTYHNLNDFSITISVYYNCIYLKIF